MAVQDQEPHASVDDHPGSRHEEAEDGVTLFSIIQAFSDDAPKIAIDMTEDESVADQAIKTLMDRVEAHSARYKKDDARELHRAGTRTSGPMCRQSGESMISYVSRRRRWYKRLQLLDKDLREHSLGFPDGLLWRIRAGQIVDTHVGG